MWWRRAYHHIITCTYTYIYTDVTLLIRVSMFNYQISAAIHYNCYFYRLSLFVYSYMTNYIYNRIKYVCVHARTHAESEYLILWRFQSAIDVYICVNVRKFVMRLRTQYHFSSHQWLVIALNVTTPTCI